MPTSINTSQRLSEIFAKTKLVCFGRYALEVPYEAELVWGSNGIPLPIHAKPIDVGVMETLVAEEIAKARRDDSSAEIIYSGPGPVSDSWQLRFYADKYDKADGSLFFTTHVKKGRYIFSTMDAVAEKNDSESAAIQRQLNLVSQLRLRQPDELPKEPGYCIEHAFLPINRYADQEVIAAGIRFPSLPDVTFSVSSNKDAYADLSPQGLAEARPKLSLLARIAEAKRIQGGRYPHRVVLREGKRAVQHWKGEESLIRRADGVHDFEWALVGNPGDVAVPSSFSAVMYTKVRHNTVGAAASASLTDDEAVAMFDRLLSGLKFRVRVPGSPAGSYYFEAERPQSMP